MLLFNANVYYFNMANGMKHIKQLIFVYECKLHVKSLLRILSVLLLMSFGPFDIDVHSSYNKMLFDHFGISSIVFECV